MAKKKKKLNRRLLMLLGVTFLLVVVSITIAILFSRPKDPEVYMTRVETILAKESLEPSDFSDAQRDLREAMGASGDHPSPRIYTLYSRVFYRQANEDVSLTTTQRRDSIRGSFSILQEGLLKHPRNPEILAMLAERLWEVINPNRHENPSQSYANQYISHATDLLENEEDAELYYRRAMAQTVLAETNPAKYTSAALEDFKKATQLAPEELRYWLARAQYLTGIERPEEAEEVLKEAAAANPTMAEPRIILAEYYRKSNASGPSRALIEEAIQVDPDNPSGYLAMSQYYRRDGAMDDARQALATALEKNPAEARVYKELALLDWQEQDYSGAIDVIRRGLEAVDAAENEPDGTPLVQARLELLHQLGLYLLNQYEMVRQDPQARRAILDEVEQIDAQMARVGEGLVQRRQIAGRLAYLKGNLDDARKHLQAYLQAVGVGRIDGASALALVQLYDRLNMPARAENLVSSLIRTERFRNQPYFLTIAANIAIANQEYDRAQSYLRRAIDADPDNENLQKMLADLENPSEAPQSAVGRKLVLQQVEELLLEEQYDEAALLLEEMLETNPDDRQAFIQLIQVYERANRKEKAIEVVQQHLQKNPDDAAMQKVLSLLKETDPEKRFQIEMAGTDAIEDPLNQAMQRWLIAMRYGKVDEARTYLDEARTLAPENPRILREMFDTMLRERNFATAREVVEEMRDVAPEMALESEARLLVAENKPSEAIPLLVQYLGDRPYDQQARILLGQCYAMNNQLESARQQFRTCLQNDERYVPAMAQLARLELAENNHAGYEEWIQMAYELPEGKRHPYIREQYLQLTEIQPENQADAIKKRQQIFDRNPENLTNANRLAQLYELQQDFTRAERIYEHIMARMPNAQKFMLARRLGELYVKTGKAAQADDLFGRLIQSAKQTGNDALLSQAYISYAAFLATREPSTAQNFYDKAIEASPESPGVFQAVANFHTLLAEQYTDEGRLDEAQQQWDESEEALRKVVELSENPLNVRRQLYRQYINSGKVDKAVEGYQSILADHPGDYSARVGLGLAYFRLNELDSAMTAFSRAIESDANRPEAFVHRSQVHLARQDYQQALSDLNRAVSVSRAPAVRYELAEVYKASGDMSSAIREYRTILNDFPRHQKTYTALATALMQQKNWQGALDVLARAMQQFPDAAAFPLLASDVAIQAGSPEVAIPLLLEAVREMPNNPRLVGQYLMILIDSGQAPQARAVISEMENRPTVRARALAARAYLNARQGAEDPVGGFVEAIQAARDADDVMYVGQQMLKTLGLQKSVANSDDIIQAKPKDWSVYSLAAGWMLMSGQLEEARDTLLKAKELEQSTASKLDLSKKLALIYQYLGDYPKAEAEYKRVLAIQPYDKSSLNNLAYLYTDMMDRPGDAKALIEKAISRYPGDSNLVDTYAWTLAKLGEYDRALASYRTVLREGHPSEETLYHIGYVYEQKKQYREALNYYRQVDAALQSGDQPDLHKKVQAGLARVRSAVGEE